LSRRIENLAHLISCPVKSILCSEAFPFVSIVPVTELGVELLGAHVASGVTAGDKVATGASFLEHVKSKSSIVNFDALNSSHDHADDLIVDYQLVE